MDKGILFVFSIYKDLHLLVQSRKDLSTCHETKVEIKIISFRSTNVTYTLQPTSFHFHQLAESYIIFPRKSFEKNQRLWHRSDMAINDFDSRGSDIQRVSPEGVE